MSDERTLKILNIVVPLAGICCLALGGYNIHLYLRDENVVSMMGATVGIITGIYILANSRG